jgi:glycosyltransferase involved in cell wall biosynthesis
MKIAFVHPFLFRYARGIERFTLNLANTLARAGVEVHLLTWRWPRSVHIDKLDERVQVHAFPTSRYYAAQAIVPFYTWHLLWHAYDFVWVFFAGYGEAEAIHFASQFRSIPYGVILHYPFAQVPHRYQDLRRFNFARRADVIISTSSYVAGGVRLSLGLESVIVTSAVDAKHFQPNPGQRKQDRAGLGVNDDVPILLTVAALEERKGIQHVVKALPQLLETHPRLKYMVVGDGPYRATLEAQIQRLELKNVARLVGAVENIYPYYNVADIFLLLSIGEASPIAPLEAMAMELPIVVSDSPPYDEIVDSRFGVRISEQDSGELVKAIDSLLSDASRRRRMGSEGRACVRAAYSWQAIAERYLELSCPRQSKR